MRRTDADGRTEDRKAKEIPAGEKGKRRAALAAVLAVVLLAAAVLPRLIGGAAAAGTGYTVEQAARRDLLVSVTGSATLEPADSYQVNTLVSGAILTAPFEEDDLVEMGALLYELDSGDAQTSVSRAELSVEQARLVYDQAMEALHPTALISGTIQEGLCPQWRQCDGGDRTGQNRRQHGLVHRLSVPLCGTFGILCGPAGHGVRG